MELRERIENEPFEEVIVIEKTLVESSVETRASNNGSLDASMSLESNFNAPVVQIQAATNTGRALKRTPFPRDNHPSYDANFREDERWFVESEAERLEIIQKQQELSQICRPGPFYTLLRAVTSREDPELMCELIDQFGLGACGDVYKVKTGQLQLPNSPETAILEHVDLRDNVYPEDMIPAITILRDMHHPNVVRLYESYLPSDYHLWIMTETLNAISIFSLQEHCRVREAAIASICKGTCTALQYLHSKSIVYSVLERCNIAVTASGEIKLALVTGCRKLSEPAGKLDRLSGFVACIAPEMASEEGYDTKADIWALGITLLEIFSPDHPHFDVKFLEDICDYKENGPPKVRRSKASRQLRDFISRCLCVDPEQRASAAELLEHEFIKQGCSDEDLALLASNGMARREMNIGYTRAPEYIGF